MPAGPGVMPAGCGVVDVGCHIKEGAKSVVGEIVGAFADGCIEVLKYVATFWMDVPSPQIATGSGSSWQLASSVSEIQGYLAPITGFLAVISYVIAVGKVAVTQDAKTGTHNVMRQLATLTLSAVAIEGGLQLLIVGGDKFSPWIISRASGKSASEGVKELLLSLFGTGQASSALGAFLIIFILTLLSSLAQAVFMVIRGAVLMVLAAFLPLSAAGTATEEGWMRFKRVTMWMVAFALYKPVAAIIYAVGIKLTQTSTKGAGVKSEPTLQNAIYGFTIITLAALALPAFIKLLEPMAAVGSSNAFSGGAAAGVIASGAAMVALGGGGAAAAGGGAAAGSGGGIGGGTPGGGGVPGPAGSGGPSGGSSGPSPSGGSSGGLSDGGGASGSASGSATNSEGTGGSQTSSGDSSSSGSGSGDGSGSGGGSAAPGGRSGRNGADGSNGVDGSRGSDGSRGAQGADGVSDRGASSSEGSSSAGSGAGSAGRRGGQGAANAVQRVSRGVQEGAESALDDGAGDGAQQR